MKSANSRKKGPGRYHWPSRKLLSDYQAAGGKAKFGGIYNFLRRQR